MQQVAEWLEKLVLGQYAQRFAENNIDFAILPDLTDQNLKELGVSSLGHRRQLLRAITELASREKNPPNTAVAAAQSAAPRDSAERRQVTVMFCERPARASPMETRTFLPQRTRAEWFSCSASSRLLPFQGM